MMSALKIAATGMQAQQTNVDVLSNNIANLNTTGYKRQLPAFNDLLYQNKIGVGALTAEDGSVTPTGAQVGLGVQVGGIYRVMNQGNVTETSNAFDVAIQGRGFFKVTAPDGTSIFTRDGSFQVNADGNIVTKEGYLLDPNISISVDAVDLTISQTGVVSYKVNNTTTNAGNITISMFTNDAGLESIGDNFYRETEASGTVSDVTPGDSGSGTLLQGFLETSNVDPIESVTSLITAQRAYELNSRVISTADEMLSAVNQIR